MQTPLDMLRLAAAKPLGVHTVATPELLDANESPDLTDDQRNSLACQNIAELSGEEMDQFSSIWSSLREKHYMDEDDPNRGRDYARAAIAFCWCDSARNRFYSDAVKIWEVVCMLRELPATLTARMFVVANGANAFAGIDDETKKNSKLTTSTPKNADGSGD